jgi:hypothetical protein
MVCKMEATLPEATAGLGKEPVPSGWDDSLAGQLLVHFAGSSRRWTFCAVFRL